MTPVFILHPFTSVLLCFYHSIKCCPVLFRSFREWCMFSAMLTTKQWLVKDRHTAYVTFNEYMSLCYSTRQYVKDRTESSTALCKLCAFFIMGYLILIVTNMQCHFPLGHQDSFTPTTFFNLKATTEWKAPQATIISCNLKATLWICCTISGLVLFCLY